MSRAPKDGKPGTTDQWPPWEAPPETTPSGYLPACDDPESNPNAAGETLRNPDRDKAANATKARKPLTSKTRPATDQAIQIQQDLQTIRNK